MALNEEIPDRDERLRRCIPVILQDACRNWIFHLEAFVDCERNSMDSVLERLDTFLSKHLLYWIECMSFLGWVDVISTYLHRLSAWLTVGFVLIPSNYHYIGILILLDTRYSTPWRSTCTNPGRSSIHPSLRSNYFQSRNADILFRIVVNALSITSIQKILCNRSTKSKVIRVQLFKFADNRQPPRCRASQILIL